MGNYLTNAEVTEGRLYDIAKAWWDKAAAGINTAWIDQDIADAEGIVDGYVSSRYLTPVTAASAIEILRAITMRLVHAAAYRRLPKGDVPDGVRAAEKDALQQLRDIRTGRFRLDGAVEVDANANAGGGLAEVYYNTPALTRSNLSGF